MSDAILLTGATGFLGMELIARWLEDDAGPDVFVAVRARDAAGARARVDELLGRLYEEPPRAAARLRPVPAELTAEGLGLDPGDRIDIVRNVGRVVHCAASISFTLPLDEARSINVGGTSHVLDLAREIDHLRRVVHVSTAYVAGRARGRFREADLDCGQHFRNTYEQTKCEAELLVASASDLPLAVLRPSIVVGESDSGWTSAFNVVYWPLQAFARGLFAELPADPAGIVDLVPVDHVTELLDRLAFAPDAAGTFSAVAGDRAVTVAELVELACRLMNRPVPALSPPGTLPAGHPGAMFAPYFDVKAAFDDRRSRELLGTGAPRAKDYFGALLEYGRRARWGKRPLTRQSARDLVAVT
jgi:thioester reductase-like protein